MTTDEKSQLGESTDVTVRIQTDEILLRVVKSLSQQLLPLIEGEVQRAIQTEFRLQVRALLVAELQKFIDGGLTYNGKTLHELVEHWLTAPHSHSERPRLEETLANILHDSVRRIEADLYRAHLDEFRTKLRERVAEIIFSKG